MEDYIQEFEKLIGQATQSQRFNESNGDCKRCGRSLKGMSKLEKGQHSGIIYI